MKILVTGAAGFIGHHLVERLARDGYTVVGLDNINTYYDTRLKLARLAESGIPADAIAAHTPIQSHKHPAYRFVKADLLDREYLDALFHHEAFDAVVNLAAQAGVRYSIENPQTYVDSNITGFLNLLECIRRHPVKHLLYASSSSVYGGNTLTPFSEAHSVDNPVSLYAATKKSNELMAHVYAHLFGIPATGLRFFTVYGPWGRPDMAPMLFADAILQGRPIKVFNHGDMQRDFTYIDDIIEGIVRLLPLPPQGTPPYTLYNLGCGHPVPLMEFIHTLEATLGHKAILEMHPMQPGDVPTTYADTTHLHALTGYAPSTPLSTGLTAFATWFTTQNPLVSGE